MAQHCLKDLPTQQVPGLSFAAHLPREDSADAIIAPGKGLDSLHNGAVVGTGSLRRTSQIAALRTDLRFKPIMGNVDTRLRKLQAGDYDAIVLATAGLKRLGILEGWKDSEFGDLQVQPLDILPAAGQAVLVLETVSASWIQEMLAPLNDPDTESAATAERTFLRRFGTGCSVPVAAHATVENGSLRLEGLVASPDGTSILRGIEQGDASCADAIGTELAGRLCAQGAGDLLRGIA